MNKEHRNDIITGTVAVFLSAVGLMQLSTVEAFTWGGDVGPKFIPRLLLWTLLAMGVALVGWALARQAVAKRDAFREKDEAGPSGKTWVPYVAPVVMVVSLVVYRYLLSSLGFAWSSLLFTVLWVFLLRTMDGKKHAGRLFWIPVEAVAITGSLFLLFDKILRVPLP